MAFSDLDDEYGSQVLATSHAFRVVQLHEMRRETLSVGYPDDLVLRRTSSDGAVGFRWL